MIPLLGAALGAMAGNYAAETMKGAPVDDLMTMTKPRQRRWAKAIAGQRAQELLGNANVRAFLRVIRRGETGNENDPAQYRRRQSKNQVYFDAPPWVHPRSIAPGGATTAAGAYQLKDGTWKDRAEDMGLKDFSPLSQDLAAVGCIAFRGALPAVLRGDTRAAYALLVDEWTSLPGAKENKLLTPEKADFIFAKWGGRATGK